MRKKISSKSIYKNHWKLRLDTAVCDKRKFDRILVGHAVNETA